MSSNSPGHFFPTFPSYNPPPLPSFQSFTPPPPIMPQSFGLSPSRMTELTFPLTSNGYQSSPLLNPTSYLPTHSLENRTNPSSLVDRSIVPYQPVAHQFGEIRPSYYWTPPKDLRLPTLTFEPIEIHVENPFTKPPTPTQPLYTNHDRLSFIHSAPAAQLEQINQLFLRSLSCQFAPQLPGTAMQELAPFTLKYPPVSPYSLPNGFAMTISTPPPPRSSVEISVVGEENNQQPSASTVPNMASQALTNLRIGLAYLGMANQDLSLKERTEILDAYSRSLRSQSSNQDPVKSSTLEPKKLSDVTPTPSQKQTAAPSRIKELFGYDRKNNHEGWGPYLKTDYVQCYDKIRFDPSHMLKAEKISDLIPNLEEFSSNMVIHGKEVHTSSQIPMEGFEAKSKELMELFTKSAMLHKSGIIATYLFNGINVSENEFGQSVALRSKSFNDHVLTIGCYNRSYGVNWDFTQRVSDEFQGRENFSTEQMRNQLAFASKACDLLGPNYYVTFELHSEATLQYYNAFEKLCDAQKDLVRKHILVVTLGGIRPIPKEFGLDVRNIYSQDDIAYKTYGKSFLDNPNYNMKVVESITPKNEQMYGIGDHAYLGKTYTIQGQNTQNNFDDKYTYLRLRD